MAQQAHLLRLLVKVVLLVMLKSLVTGDFVHLVLLPALISLYDSGFWCHVRSRRRFIRHLPNLVTDGYYRWFMISNLYLRGPFRCQYHWYVKWYDCYRNNAQFTNVTVSTIGTRKFLVQLHWWLAQFTPTGGAAGFTTVAGTTVTAVPVTSLRLMRSPLTSTGVIREELTVTGDMNVKAHLCRVPASPQVFTSRVRSVVSPLQARLEAPRPSWNYRYRYTVNAVWCLYPTFWHDHHR